MAGDKEAKKAKVIYRIECRDCEQPLAESAKGENFKPESEVLECECGEKNQVPKVLIIFPKKED